AGRSRPAPRPVRPVRGRSPTSSPPQATGSSPGASGPRPVWCPADSDGSNDLLAGRARTRPRLSAPDGPLATAVRGHRRITGRPVAPRPVAGPGDTDPRAGRDGPGRAGRRAQGERTTAEQVGAVVLASERQGLTE